MFFPPNSRIVFPDVYKMCIAAFLLKDLCRMSLNASDTKCYGNTEDFTARTVARSLYSN